MFELSMKDTFSACVEVLERELRPIHYRELTELTLAKLAVPKRSVNFEKEIENIREKLLLAEQRGTFYVGRPHCVGALRRWFSTGQLCFNLDPPVIIPGNATSGVSGGFEAWSRSASMVTHNPALTNTAMLRHLRVKALVLEKHVSEWFAEKYPDFYMPPDNADRFDSWCDHDFKLSVNGTVFRVDVAGPDKNGHYGHRGRKPRTDLHLVCRIAGRNCVWEGATRGDRFTDCVIPETITSPAAVLVWLNCVSLGMDYPAISNAAHRREVAA